MTGTVLQGDAIEQMANIAPGSINMCITSPPYFRMRDYGVDGQIGMETTPDDYIAKLVTVFREVRRVLRDDGTLWVNIADCYAGGWRGGNSEYITGYQPKMPKSVTIGYKRKDLIGIPWMLAFALRADGWYLRQEIIWHKTNSMPESVTDRFKKSHEQIFLLSKSSKYAFNYAAIREPAVTKGAQNSFARKTAVVSAPGQPKQHRDDRPEVEYSQMRTKGSVWSVPTKPYKGAHFATFPTALIRPCIEAGCPDGGVVLDPFFGAGTTGLVAEELGRDYIGIELNEEYVKLAKERLNVK